jgi:putative OmpA-OmpF-like porin
MKKYLILTIALLAGISLTTYAQDEDTDATSEATEDTGEYGAKAGDITGAILFGRGSFLDYGSLPQAPSSNWGYGGQGNVNWNVNGQPPTANVSVSGSSATNMIGGEGRYFITDVIAATISGGAVIRNTEPLQNVQYFYINPSSSTGLSTGNDPNTSTQSWVPHYGSVVSDNRIEANVNVGGEYHFPSTRFKRLFPYVGANFNYYYSRISQYDPSIYYQNSSNGTGGTDVLVVDIGVRSSVVQGYGGQAVAGIDVYLVPGIFVGLSTRPVSYLYVTNVQTPAPGLENRESASHTWSIFSQTFIKVGFILGDL